MPLNMRLFALLSIVFWAYFAIIDAGEQIRYAAVIFRHGDRTPVDPCPTDPYRNESLWPVKFGELTNTGKMQQFSFGQWLRTRYRYLVSINFDPTEVYVKSTDVDRTMMSASANMAGMFPPVNSEIWNPKLLWQPIPVHTMPQKQDEVLAMERNCPYYDKEYNRVKNSPEYKERLGNYKGLMDYLSEHVGFQVQDYSDILNIYSNLKIEQINNLKLPEWTNKVFPEQLFEPACYTFRTETATPLMARLRIGPFLKEVTGNMMKMMHYYNSKDPFNTRKYDDLDGKTPMKLNIYSAHDLNIGSILNGLGIYDGKCPVYTSAIFFELVYVDSTQIHFIKILYRNNTDNTHPPVYMPIPGCGYHCPLERFMSIYDKLIPDDWEKECFQRFPLALVLVSVSCVLIAITAFFSYFCFCHWIFCKKNYHSVGAVEKRSNISETRTLSGGVGRQRHS